MPSPPQSATTKSGSTLGVDPLGVGSRRSEGRTPPPAPSATYAKRARDGAAAEYIEAVNAIEEGGEKLESPSGAQRRARAGTLPSTLPAAPRQIEAADTPDTPDEKTPKTTPARTSALSPAYPSTAPNRPALRHTASSAANLESPSQTGRTRSGSLTLGQNGLGSAFGQSPFSNAWLSNHGPAKLPHSKIQQEDEQAQFPSSDSNNTSLDLNFSTIDYLGLDESGDLPPASMSELRQQAQQAIADSGPASRLSSRVRSSTVSNFARNTRPSVTSSAYQREYPTEEEYVYQQMGQMSLQDAPDGPYNSGMTQGYGYGKDVHRPRATTIGALDKARTAMGYLSSIPQSPMPGHMYDASFGSGYYPPRSRSDRDLTRERSSSRGPRMSMSSHTSRAGTPDVIGSSTPQLPTRSLWIGNLDVNATSDALLHVFAPYGAIESVRMLPEKTCAFVNYMEKGDAIRARDDVLNRMGGHVAALSETAPVRVGFGKIDATPGTSSVNGSGGKSSSGMYPNGNGVSASSIPPVPPLPPSLANVMSSSSSPPERDSETSSLPTRALWIGSIPGTTSSATLLQIFSPFGPVESARVLLHKCCGFVNFERLDSAVSARNALNGRDILGSDVGPIRIGFARVPTKSPTIGAEGDEASSPQKLTEQLSAVKGATAVSTEQQISAEGGGLENYRSQLVIDLVKQGIHEQVLEKGLSNGGVVSDQQMIMTVLSGGREEEDGDIKAAADPRSPTTYYTAIPVITERPTRRFDSIRLKELRKRLDGGQCTQAEVDQIANELMEDCAELASDYIGNTVIQKLFERTAPPLRTMMLERVAPHLAMVGIHKNGTWAAQKIIECSITDEERQLIVSNLRPFAPPLMCDSLGNYVCAGTLRFGAPWNDYVYDAMIDRIWDIAQNRFGARCMRTCLESSHISSYQKKRIAAAIILNSIPLATNPNGALLLTWLVDQSQLPGRYGLLANRCAPHISHLCTHKLASLTILRVMTQTAEPAAASTLVHAIFDSQDDSVLTDILSDANNGAQVIGKILSINSLTPEDKQKTMETCRRVLPIIKATSSPPYRTLMEAVGLPLPAGMSKFGPNRTNPTWQNAPPQPAYGFYPYRQPNGSPMVGRPPSIAAFNPLGQSLSPLLVPQNLPLGQVSRNASPNVNGSPRTPQARHHGRLSPGAGLISPASDPFNPFASPSIDGPFYHTPGVRMGSSLAHSSVTFEPQPNVGGLGFMSPQTPRQSFYPQQMPGMYAGYRG